MAPITTSTEINQPALDVFAYTTDPIRNPTRPASPSGRKGVIDGHLDRSGTPSVGDKWLTT